jgi:uncharacterized protein YdeI (BOF family)
MKSYLLSLLITGMTLASFNSIAAFSDKSNGEWVTLSGKVSGVSARSFILQVDGKKIPVEMDDYGWGADGYKLVNGDQVVVSGRIDKDFLEKKKVEAGSVYVKNLNTYFYANPADEEDLLYIPTTYSYFSTVLPEGASVDLQGKVTSVSGREFTVDTGFRKVTVDTKSLLYNPLDNVGYTKIKVGDRVKVSGKVQDDLFDTKEVSANFLTKLL